MCEKSDTVSYLANLIESEIRDNLRAKITAYCSGIINIDLLYKGKVISSNTCKIITDDK